MTRVDTCVSRPCLHGAACRSSVDSYECTCFAGYYGRNCEFVEARLGQEGSVVPAEGEETTSSRSDQVTVSQNSVAGGVQSLVESQAALTTRQVLLIACLGVGLPVLLMLAAILFFVARKYRRDAKRTRRHHHHQHQQQLSCERQNRLNDEDETKRLNNKNAARIDLADVPETSIYLSLIDRKKDPGDSKGGGSSGGGGSPAAVGQPYASLIAKRNDLRIQMTNDVNIDTGV